MPVIPFDKAAHAIEYTCFALLINRTLSHYLRQSSARLQYILTWLAVSAFGGLDELFQSTVPGRTPDVFDFLTDSCAGAVAIALVILWRRRRRGYFSFK